MILCVFRCGLGCAVTCVHATSHATCVHACLCMHINEKRRTPGPTWLGRMTPWGPQTTARAPVGPPDLQISPAARRLHQHTQWHVGAHAHTSLTCAAQHGVKHTHHHVTDILPWYKLARRPSTAHQGEAFGLIHPSLHLQHRRGVHKICGGKARWEGSTILVSTIRTHTLATPHHHRPPWVYGTPCVSVEAD
jgi:hypothetical protein